MQSAQLEPGANHTIKVSGALIFSTVNALWEQSQYLFKQAQKQLNFDLTGITQSDSAGVALLLAWTRSALSCKKEIVFSALPEQMRAIVKVSGLEEILRTK